MHNFLFLLPLLFLLLTSGCVSDEAEDVNGGTTSFDREAMLAHWTDAIFLPAAEDFTAAAVRQRSAATTYATSGTTDDLQALRAAFEEAYLSWQRLSPFTTGPAETARLRARFNTYPTDTARLIAEPEANLDLPSNIDIQGFPAIDYLLYGTPEPAEHAALLVKLTEDIVERAEVATASWTGEDRDRYVANAGNSATASVDRTVNDFIFWYEKHLRAGKVGIPAGVFSSSPRAELTEAPYHGALGQRLFLAALDGGERFFVKDPGLKSYLDALDVKPGGTLLSDRITDNFARVRTLASQLETDFGEQVRSDNTAMLELYDALQANVILLKVDMLQALSINVDYVDADGD